MSPSLLPIASVSPSGLNATLVTASVWPRAAVGAESGLLMSHTNAVVSLMPTASERPSGSKASAVTAASYGLRHGRRSGRIGEIPEADVPVTAARRQLSAHPD